MAVQIATAVKWLLGGRYPACTCIKFGLRYSLWVALEALILDLEAAILNDLRGTAFIVWWCVGVAVRMGVTSWLRVLGGLCVPYC